MVVKNKQSRLAPRHNLRHALKPKTQRRASAAIPPLTDKSDKSRRVDVLSPSDRTFLQVYLKTGDRQAAYLAAGGSSKTPKESASALFNTKRIQAALLDAYNRHIRRLSDKMAITTDKVLQDLEDARVGAMNDQQYAAAIKASELHGKHIGMFREDAGDRDRAPRVIIHNYSDNAQVAIMGNDQSQHVPVLEHQSVLEHQQVSVSQQEPTGAPPSQQEELTDDDLL